MSASIAENNAICEGGACVPSNGACSRVVGKDDADLLVVARLQLLRVAERGKEALIVGQAKEVDLLGRCGQGWSKVNPAWIAIRSGGVHVCLDVGNGDIDVLVGSVGHLAGRGVAEHHGDLGHAASG